MKIAIVTDSNSGIFPQRGEELGVFVVPMPAILDGQEYFEGVNMTTQEFYQRINAGADASTSQPSPADVEATWTRLLDQGYDQIVHIPMSSGLSASCATAQGLAADFDGKVQVVDNHRISVTLCDAVLDAIALVKEGADAKTVKEQLEASGMDSVVYLGVDTLKFFKKNGRCTAATAALGTVLNIKPVLKCDGERFDAIAKARGEAACRQKIISCIQEAVAEMEAKGFDLSIGVAECFVDPAEKETWLAQVREALPGRELHYEPLSFSIVCHTGPNAYGLGVTRRIRP